MGDLPSIDVLKYGPLGLALACVLAFTLTLRGFNALVSDPNASAEKFQSAQRLNYGAMAVFSVVGLVGLWLTWVEFNGNQIRVAQIVVDPWAETDIPNAQRPIIHVCNTSYQGGRVIKIACKSGEDKDVDIDYRPYIEHVRQQAVEQAIQTRQGLVRPSVDEPAI